MPHWMVHPQHGTMPVYSMSEVTQVQGSGWKLLNSGESPDYSLLEPKKDEPAPPIQEAIAPVDEPEVTSQETLQAVAQQPKKRRPGRPRRKDSPDVRGELPAGGLS